MKRKIGLLILALGTFIGSAHDPWMMVALGLIYVGNALYDDWEEEQEIRP